MGRRECIGVQKMAQTRRFTDKFVQSLKPRESRYEVYEGGGFAIRVSPAGGKTWIWFYRFEGRHRRLTLGEYPTLGLADTRVKLAAARKLLECGIDPGERELQQKRTERAAETVVEVAEAYIEKWARPRKRSASEDERILRKDVIPVWRSRKAKDIARRDVIAMLDKIVDRGAPIAANRTLAVVRRMFGWALSRDLIQANPCAAIKAPAKENRRDRVLTTEEIAGFWRALDDPATPISLQIRLALRLQLISAQRKGEVINAEWRDFDIAQGIWTIPGEKAKNGLPHRVPLSPLARAVLDAIPEPHSGWLFPSPRGNGPVGGQSVDHAMHRNHDVLGIGGATPHDLRRSAASYMTSVGVSRLVVSKVLNHAETGVTAVYDRHSYDVEKRAALDAWSKRLEEIIGAHLNCTNRVPSRASSQ
jgi:integrase